jgi:hypothetical protein
MKKDFGVASDCVAAGKVSKPRVPASILAILHAKRGAVMATKRKPSRAATKLAARREITS